MESVIGKIGRAETSTDPAPINMSGDNRDVQTEETNGRQA